MGGFGDIDNWNELNLAAGKVAQIHGLDPEDLNNLQIAMKLAVQNETDLNRKTAMVLRMKDVLEKIAKGGMKDAVFAALGLA